MLKRWISCPEHLAPEDIAEGDTRFLHLDGGSVAYRQHGEGEHAVVFLHGFGGRLETWRHQQAALAAQYRTVSLDLWGFGASARPPTLTPHAWPRQVFGVLDALDITSATLVGHSLGGRVALMCAAQAPERVQGLILLDCDWGQAQHGYLLVREMARGPFLPRLLDGLRSDPAHVTSLMRLAYASPYDITPDRVDAHRMPLCVRGTTATFQYVCCAPPAEHRMDAALAGVRCPTLVLWGEHDRIIPVEWAMPLASRLPAARLALIAGAGHLPQDEYPAQVTDHLRDFLAGLYVPAKSA